MPNTQIDSLSIEVQSSAEKASQGIDKLISSLSSLKRSINGVDVKSFSDKLKSIGDAANKVSPDGAKRLQNLSSALSGLSKVNISPNIATEIGNIGKALNNITDAQVTRVERLARALNSMPARTINIPSVGTGTTTPNSTALAPTTGGGFGGAIAPTASNIQPATAAVNNFGNAASSAAQRTNLLQQALARIKSAMSSMSGTFGQAVSNIAGFGARLRGVFSSIGSGVKSAYSSISGFVAKIRTLGSGVLQGPVAMLRSLKNELTGVGTSAGTASNGFTRLLSTIGRLIGYSILYSLINMVSSALKEGVNNLYQYSATVNGPFYQSMNTLSTSFQYLRNSIAAAAAPLVNALAPAFDAVIDKIVTAVNAVGKFFAALTGKGFYTKAKKVSKTYATIANNAGSVGSSASDAAKKVSKSTKATTDSVKELERTILDFDELHVLNDISDAASGGGSSPSGGGGSGSPSGGGITSSTPDYGSMFEDVPIESEIQDLAKKIRDMIENGDWEGLGTLLGEKLNEMVGSVDWAGIGDKLGYGINGALQTMYYFLRAFDFYALGEDIATMLNHVIGQIDWHIAGGLLTRWWVSVIDFFMGFIHGFDWGQLARAISDFIEGAFDEAVEWLNSYDWSQVGRDLYNDIKDFITNLDVSGMADSIFTFMGTAIRTAFDLLGGIFGELWGDVVDAWAQHVAEYDYGSFAANLFTAISDALGDLEQWSIDHILTPFMRGLLGDEEWDSITTHVQGCLDDIERIADGAALAIGLIMTLAGPATRPLGIALMVAGGFAGIGSVIEDWEKTGHDVSTALADIEEIVGGAMLALGAVLTFSGANPELGIPLMIMGATQLAASAALNWDNIPAEIKRVISSITMVVSAGMLALGAVLTFTLANVPLGLGLMVVGAVSLATSIMANWEATPNKVQSVITTITTIVSVGLLAIGAILVLTLANLPLGLGLIAAGAVGLAASLGVQWDGIPSQISSVLTKILLIAGGAMLALGLILTLTLANLPLGVGLIIAGAASLATAAAINWDTITQKIESFFQKYGFLASAGLIALGTLLALTWVGTPLGIGMIIAGVAGMVASVALNWDTIKQKIQEFFKEYGEIIGKAAIAIGTVLLLTPMFPIGIALILLGIGSTIAGVEANGGNITEKVRGGLEGIHGKFTEFHDKVKETWGNIKQTIADKWEEIKQNTSEKWGDIKSKLSETWNNLKQKAGEIWGNLKQTISDKWEDIKKKTSETWGDIKSKLSETWDNLKQKASETWSSIKQTVSDKWADIKKKTSDTWNTVKSTTSSTWNNVKSTVSSAASGVASNVKQKFNESSQSVSSSTSKMKQSASTGLGSSDASGLRGVAASAFKAVASAAKSKLGEASKTVSSEVGKMKQTFSGANLGSIVQKGFSAVASNIQSQMNKAVSIVSNAVSRIRSALSNINSLVSNTINNMNTRINSAINSMNSRVDRAVSRAQSRMNSVHTGGLFSFSFFANGGFPESGELFFARENGIPEMVGSIGGNTAVANNEDIVNAVSQGVAEAMISVLSQNQNNNGEAPVFEVIVKTEDDEVLARAVTRGQQKMNYRMSATG